VNASRNNSGRSLFFGLFQDRRLKQRLLSVVLLAFLCQLTIPYLRFDCPLYAAGVHAAKPNCKLVAVAKLSTAVDPAKPVPHQSHAASSCMLCAVSGPGGLYITTGFLPLPLPPVPADIWLPATGEASDTSPIIGSSARAPPA
jgi:hypothetical protein